MPLRILQHRIPKIRNNSASFSETAKAARSQATCQGRWQLRHLQDSYQQDRVCSYTGSALVKSICNCARSRTTNCSLLTCAETTCTSPRFRLSTYRGGLVGHWEVVPGCMAWPWFRNKRFLYAYAATCAACHAPVHACTLSGNAGPVNASPWSVITADCVGLS